MNIKSDGVIMKERIIFLDIDGPMIHTPLYFLDNNVSGTRSHMSTTAIAILYNLCKKYNAKIVTNTAHNGHVRDGVFNVKMDLIKHGLLEEFFHRDWQTNYCHEEYEKRISDRYLGITDWLHNHYEVDWVCFDDVKFTDDPRLIVVDFHFGIDYNSYRKALKIWGIQK